MPLRNTVLIGRLVLASLAVLATGGCQSRPEARHEPSVPSYYPANVTGIAVLPKAIVRVAVMPPASTGDHVESFALTQAVLENLQASGRFEVVPVDPALLEHAFGRERYLSTDNLPEELPAFLEHQYGTRTVLFTDATMADPYPPVTLGLRQKLVYLGETPVFLWSADEVFDAGNPAVAMGAKRYAREMDNRSYPLDLGGGILLSPRRFADYALFTLFSTLPAREIRTITTDTASQ